MQTIEGWTVRVDPELLLAEHKATWQRSRTALSNHLQRVKFIVDEDHLESLQQLPIWIEFENHELGNMQYHPSRGWLLAHGHDPRLVKHVHIPIARRLYARQMWAQHPYVVLHELAHAYHDRFLGFDNKEIEAIFEAAKQSKKYDRVLVHTGGTARHYGLNNAKEYFAESTEAYLGVNDFYPFVRAELKEHDPDMFALMMKVWGPIK